MKETLYIALILLFCGINLQAQIVKINPNLKIEETNLTYIINGWNYKMYSSYDNKKTDSLIVKLAKISTSTLTVEIDFSKSKPIVYVVLGSDYAEYDGSYTKQVEFESYDLELNSDNFVKDDIIMGYFRGKTMPITVENRTYDIEFQGVFRHIIGKFMIKNNADSEYFIMDKL